MAWCWESVIQVCQEDYGFLLSDAHKESDLQIRIERSLTAAPEKSLLSNSKMTFLGNASVSTSASLYSRGGDENNPDGYSKVTVPGSKLNEGKPS